VKQPPHGTCQCMRSTCLYELALEKGKTSKPQADMAKLHSPQLVMLLSLRYR